MAKKNTAKARALQLNVEGLFKLLGGTADDRLRFWEIFKGVTTPIEHILVSHQFEVLQGLVNQVQVSVKTLKDTSEKIIKRG
jgi:hypothetical protein